MRNKRILFISVLLFMIVLSIGAISAQDVDDAIASSSDEIAIGDSDSVSNSVSGGVDVVTENPWNTAGELSYSIPSDAKTIKSADVYVNVYAGSAKNTHGANANITITTANGDTKYNEALWIEDASTDGTVYTVNNHTTKCYSDYMIHYDVTDMLKDLNGSNLKINVDTFQMENKSFDGRIKLIALILGYDDGDDDVISYWINDDQLWTKGNVTVTFDTDDISAFSDATLTNVVLSSGDGTYMINGEFLGDADSHVSGNYYQYNKWDVKDTVTANQKTDLTVKYAGTSAYGSIKNVLSILTVYNALVTDISITPEYTSVPSAYAGTNNTLTVKVNTNKPGNYSIKLLADGVEVNETEAALIKGDNSVLLTDPTVRPIDETTVNGADNTKVNYTVELSYDGAVVDSKEVSLPVVYNGNLGYDKEYNVTGFETFANIYITGDVVIDIKDVSSYLGASAMNRTDVWTVNLDEGSEIVNGFIFIPYNWFNAKTYVENDAMFNVTFNGQTIEPMFYYRDQGNLGNYGKYGYGVLVYMVENLINTTGDNTLVLNKVNPTPAVYPSVLAYVYNTPGGSFKEVSVLLGADLLSNSNNNAGRIVKSDSQIKMFNNFNAVNATLYVLAASAQSGESNIIINGEEFVNVWSGTSSTTDLFTADITDVLDESNNISFVATGSTILALPQIIVADSGVTYKIDSIKTEYTSVPTAYAGTNNTLTVTVSNSKEGEFKAYLFADGELVDEINVTLNNGTNQIKLTDPTIRPIDETTVNGANNTEVTYSVYLSYQDAESVSSNITVPVLYNGNLGYDLEYNITGFESIDPITVNGNVVIDIKDVSSYLSASAINRTDVWTIDLNSNSFITNGFVYVPYNWFNAKTYTEDINMFKATFNGVDVAPIAWYRDQGNLGNYGQYGYGVFVYDVSDLIKTGDNSFVLNKANLTPAVYPSALVYMYNTTGSRVSKTVYISNGADLLANSYNNAGRIVKSDSTITVDTSEIVDATLYVLAASAQVGEGNIIFNGEKFVNVWSGTSSTTDLFSADVTSLIEDNNSISFVATGSTILELPQIIVISKEITPSVIAIEKVNGSAVVSGVLKGVDNEPISNAVLSYTIGNVTSNITTDDNGAFVIQGQDNTKIDIRYDGNLNYSSAKASITLENLAPVKKATHIVVDAAFSRDANDYSAGERGANFTGYLLDEDDKPVVNRTVQVAVNGPIYNLTTDEKGAFNLQINLAAANTYTYAIAFLGDDTYNSAPLASSKLTVVQKSTSITASAKTFKSTAKTKKITVTLKTIKNKYDGKTYLKSGKTITLKINGVTYTAKTNAKGQATFSIKLTKKGTFTAAINFAGDKTYKASSKSIKVTIK